MKQVCLVNLVELNPSVNGGTSRIAAEVGKLLSSWENSDQSLRIIFVVGWRFAAQFMDWFGKDALIVPYFIPLDTAYWLNAAKPKLIVSPLFGAPPFETMLARDTAHIVGMPDALLLDKPELFSAQQRKKRLRIYSQLVTADAVVTLSNHARERLQHHLHIPGEQLHVIPLGADVLPEGDNETLTLPARYVFYPANTWPHKRHVLLLRIMKQIWRHQPEVQLVLSGGRSLQFTAEIQQLMEQLQCPLDRVVDFGYVSDRQLRQLYKHAEAMIFTSSYEGFGMPLIEAMYHGCPVLCAPVTSIPEIAGDAALYINSDEPEMWADAFLNQLPLQKAMLIARGYQRAKQFTWEQTRQKWQMLLEKFIVRDTDTKVALQLEYDKAFQRQLLVELQNLAQPLGKNVSRSQELLYLMQHARQIWMIRRQFAQMLHRYLMG